MILMGHNGAGKSTVINQLMGFFPLENREYSDEIIKELELRPFINKKVGFAQEIPYFNLKLTPYDYFLFISTVNKISLIEFEFYMQKMSLEKSIKTEISKFSKGMKQRLSIIFAILSSSESLILDEPTSGLDSFGEELVIKIIKKEAKYKKLIISTHSIKLALELADEVVILQNYKVVKKFIPKNGEELEETLKKFPPKELH